MPRPDEEAFTACGSIASLGPTVAHLFSVAPPRLSAEPPLRAVVDHHNLVLGNDPIERCLVFCADGLGARIWRSCPHHLQAIAKHAGLCLPLLSVIPPKTPVCLASMFTGCQPHDHGIRRYERPVLTRDTLFDVLLRAGRRIAIVAVTDSSMDLIFRDRDIDYFSEGDDNSVTQCTMDFVNQNHHHVVVAYQQEYDDLLHETDPYSDASLQAVNNHIASFTAIAESASASWRDYNHAIVFAPDHGAHLDPNTGHGDHGEDIPEDMQLFHWYGVKGVSS